MASIDEEQREENIELSGPAFLDSIELLSAGNSALHHELLDSGGLGTGAIQLYPLVGNAMSLLYRLAICYWSCPEDRHDLPNLYGRCCTFALSSLELAFLGYYDQSLGMIRSVCEIINLLQLFTIDNSKLEQWNDILPEKRYRSFGPGAVRGELTRQKVEPYVGPKTYGSLCEFGVHTPPISDRISHDITGTMHVGSQFSTPGFLLCLNQLAMALIPALKLASSSSTLDNEISLTFQQCANELQKSLLNVDVNNYKKLLEVNEPLPPDKVQEMFSNLDSAEQTRLISASIAGLQKKGEIEQVEEFSDEHKRLILNRSLQIFNWQLLRSIARRRLGMAVQDGRNALIKRLTGLLEKLESQPHTSYTNTITLQPDIGSNTYSDNDTNDSMSEGLT